MKSNEYLIIEHRSWVAAEAAVRKKCHVTPFEITLTASLRLFVRWAFPAEAFVRCTVRDIRAVWQCHWPPRTLCTKVSSSRLQWLRRKSWLWAGKIKSTWSMLVKYTILACDFWWPMKTHGCSMKWCSHFLHFESKSLMTFGSARFLCQTKRSHEWRQG